MLTAFCFCTAVHIHVSITLFLSYCIYFVTLFIITRVFCISECLKAPMMMGKCSLGLPSLNKDFIIIIIITRDRAADGIISMIQKPAYHYVIK